MQTSVYLTEQEQRELKELEQELERSQSWIIRKSVKEYYQKMKQPTAPEMQLA